jgi:hypothetical protein
MMNTDEYGKVTISDIIGLWIISIGASLMAFGMKYIFNESIQVKIYEEIRKKFDETS